jgi:hypothetical protein
MTQWHRRLIIFLAKILGVIMIVIMVSLFLYYQLIFKKDNLIRYVPTDSLLYGTFNLNNQIKDNKFIQANYPQISSSLQNIDFNLLNNLVAYNAAIALVPDKINSQNTISYLFLFNLKEDNDNLQPYLDLIAKANWSSYLLVNNPLKRKILALSNSESVINQVKAINLQQQPSLLSKLDVVANLNKFDLSYWGKIYINVKIANEFYNNQDNLPVQLLLSHWQSNKLGQLYSGLKIQDNKILMESSDFNVLQSCQTDLSSLPNDWQAFINLNKADLQYQQLFQRLQQDNSVSYQLLAKNKTYLEGLYNFDINKLISEYFKNTTSLIILPQDKFIFSSEADNSDLAQQEILQLTHIIKEYLKINQPQIKAKELPDGSIITQIIKNPADLKPEILELVDVNNVKIGEISYFRLHDIELAYYQSKNMIYLANSKEKLAQYLKTNISNNVILCKNEANFREEVEIRGNDILNFFDYKLFNHLSWQNYSKNGNKFRLILE